MFGDCPVAHGGFERFSSRTGSHAGYQGRVGRGFDDVPGFGFAVVAGAFERGGLFVVRVDLQREPLSAVEQFDQQRESQPGFGIGARTEQFLSLSGG